MSNRERSYNTKPNKTSFKKGHKKVGGFVTGSKHSEASRQKLSDVLRGKLGAETRRWKGDDASYVAKHMWIKKMFGKANRCENPNCAYKNPKRYEWANLSGKHLREITDYKQLCPSCHRKMDINGLTFDELCAL